MKDFTLEEKIRIANGNCPYCNSPVVYEGISRYKNRYKYSRCTNCKETFKYSEIMDIKREINNNLIK